MPPRYGSARATEARGRAFDAALQQPDLMVLGYSAVSEKSLFIQGIFLTRVSLLNHITQPIFHVLDEWANAAPDSAGTSEARMSSAVGPVYWPIPTTVIRNRLPSLTVSLRRGAAMRNPAAMIITWFMVETHGEVVGFRSGGLALVAARCWFLSASGQLPAMITYWDQTARQ